MKQVVKAGWSCATDNQQRFQQLGCSWNAYELPWMHAVATVSCDSQSLRLLLLTAAATLSCLSQPACLRQQVKLCMRKASICCVINQVSKHCTLMCCASPVLTKCHCNSLKTGLNRAQAGTLNAMCRHPPEWLHMQKERCVGMSTAHSRLAVARNAP